MDTRQIVTTYCAAWNEPDKAKRTAMLEASWADDGVYHDPTGTAAGRSALVDHIAGFHEQFPGHTLAPASGVDDNGDGLRFAWVLRNGAEVVLEGMDFAELAPDGRIKRIAGFFGPFPPLDE
jgi:SnoaL-like domain